MIPGYSNLLDTRLSIDEVMEPLIKSNDIVIIEDTIKDSMNDEENYKQSSPVQIVRNSINDKPMPATTTASQERVKEMLTTTPVSYYKKHKDRYDPFLFQENTRTRPKHPPRPQIYSNRLDSTLSIQVAGDNREIRNNNSMSFRSQAILTITSKTNRHPGLE